MKTRNLLKTTLVLAILFWVLPFQLSAEKVYARDEATLDGVERIEVEGRFCDVNIVAGSGDKVKFEGEIKGGCRACSIKMMQVNTKSITNRRGLF